MPTIMPSEDEFVRNAVQFLAEIGADSSGLEPETDLFESGVLDSLGSLAFLDFLEQQRGAEIDIDTLNISMISSLRSAYAFITAERG
ncbi:acyl carrier protein [Kitasatospora sp. NBC_01287]|uniref:acyl carrier protein n=1 Tax=Kitasatospora sp. NBC_01287 TaxID=2903573 RepID=UPI00225A0185|nr:acyl carrier protein [Kitasatospora sp. NBC_01287]MCX4745039.1 acyl carrier protein [Kitasatospora sp. NBC_01287]